MPGGLPDLAGADTADAAPGPSANGGTDEAQQTPQDVVRTTVTQVSQADGYLSKAMAIAAQVNTQFPGSKQQAQMIGQLLGQAKKLFASMMTDIVKQTSRQAETSGSTGMFGR